MIAKVRHCVVSDTSVEIIANVRPTSLRLQRADSFPKCLEEHQTISRRPQTFIFVQQMRTRFCVMVCGHLVATVMDLECDVWDTNFGRWLK
jgi:hypothetical protein